MDSLMSSYPVGSSMMMKRLHVQDSSSVAVVETDSMNTALTQEKRRSALNGWFAAKDNWPTLNWDDGILTIIITASGKNTKSSIASSIANQVDPNTRFANIRLSNKYPWPPLSLLPENRLTWLSSPLFLLRIQVEPVSVAVFHRWNLPLRSDRLGLVLSDYEQRRIVTWHTRIWNKFEHHRWPRRLERY